MRQVYTAKKERSIPIFFVPEKDFPAFQKKLSAFEQKCVELWGFQANPGQVSVLFTERGDLSQILFGVSERPSFWEGAQVARGVPKGYSYFFEGVSAEEYFFLALAWGLDYYVFDAYKTKKNHSKVPLLYVPGAQLEEVQALLEVSFNVRDWINQPACDLTPEVFAEVAEKVAKTHKAKISVTRGKDLQKNYPLVHSVGKASIHAPHVVDIRWGNPKHPKITLVGKGVTFDTGGLDIKPASNMLLMKKDMGGAAQALGLADLIMRRKMPVCLRVLLPLAENSIGGNAYRPSDIITSRKGITVEIADTDAEGRLLLADALSAACEEKPDYLFDFATLTGAARIAVGTEISAFFSNRAELSSQLMQAADRAKDPLWELPLWEDYMSLLRSPVADIKSCSSGGYAGATTAALFLKQFVSADVPWVHFDLMAWNNSSKPGRPEGGEVMALRAVYEFLKGL